MRSFAIDARIDDQSHVFAHHRVSSRTFALRRIESHIFAQHGLHAVAMGTKRKGAGRSADSSGPSIHRQRMILDGAGKIDISLCPVMSFLTRPVTVRTGVGYRKDGGWLPLRRGLVVTPLSRAARSPTCPSRTLVASTLGLPARREPAALCGGAS